MESQKIESIQNEINLIQLEINQEKDQDKRNKLLQKLQVKMKEKELQRLKD